VQYAAVRVPVPEHDAHGISGAQSESVDGRTVRVSVDQRANPGSVHHRVDGTLVDVHDRVGLDRLLTRLPEPLGDAPTRAKRNPGEQPACERVPDKSAESLVFVIVRAQLIAVHQQDAFAAQVNARNLRQQLHARRIGIAFPDQKIPVAVRQVAGCAGIAEGLECRGDDRVIRVRVVIADPDLEQVAEDIQRVGLTRDGFQEANEALDGSWTRGVEVQV